MKIVQAEIDRCALCDAGLKATRHIAFFLTGADRAIAYALCDTCGPRARAGLPPQQLHRLEANLEAIAANHGIGKEEGGGR